MTAEIFDWLGREGWIVVNWWLLVSVAGWTVFPMLASMLTGLPDRGYSLARPAGILLVGYVFWLLATLGFIQNTAGNMIFAWLIVACVNGVLYARRSTQMDWRGWWKTNRGAVVSVEILFALLLISWAIYRAFQHDLTTTEKPMDLAFMSSAQRTLNYPPDDPWLSGYSISYYYFGYVMAAMLSTLSGVRTTLGYNMHLALLFALTGTVSFGIVYNLVRSRTLVAAGRLIRNGQRAAILTGLLAVVFVAVMGSYQLPLLEYPYFSGKASQSYLDFWDVNQRRDPITAADVEASAESPQDWGYWWWFRSARPVSDRSLDGGHVEVIAEFPNFSFVLGDSHPHVMALPFALMAMGLALNVLFSSQGPDLQRLVLYGLFIGGLIFLNTWDMPIYLALLLGAEVIRRLRQSGRLNPDDWVQVALMGVVVLGTMILAYLPFMVGFRSQLKGIVLNLIYPTQFPQLFLLFGPFFVILVIYLGWEMWRGRASKMLNLRLGGQVIGLIFLGLVGFVIVFAGLASLSDSIRETVLAYANANGGVRAVMENALSRRIAPKALVTLVVCFGALLIVVARLFPDSQRAEQQNESGFSAYSLSTGFTLLLVGTAFSLILLPEFVYLRDNFGTRMNTVFKFYYQAWAALGIACAYAVYSMMSQTGREGSAWMLRTAFGLLLVVIIAPAMLYPVFAVRERAWIESGQQGNPTQDLTLDGGPGFVVLDPGGDDYKAIMCLADVVGRRTGIAVAEAERDTYRPYYGRVGALTGIPVVANWLGHQGQWRGDGYSMAVGTRRSDLHILYSDLRFDVVTGVLEKYDIDYILYGSTERRDFGSAGEEKFLDNLPIVCESGLTRIFAVPDDLNLVVQRG